MDRGSARSHLVLVATAILSILVAQVALAGSSVTADDPQADTSASTKQQVKRLRKRVAALERKPSPPPAGPAGGDLAGTYPNPTIGPNAISGAEIADDTLTRGDIAAVSGTVAIALPSLATGSCNYAQGALPGVLPEDVVIANIPGNLAASVSGIAITPLRVGSPDQILLYVCNVANAGISGSPTINMRVIAIR